MKERLINLFLRVKKVDIKRGIIICFSCFLLLTGISLSKENYVFRNDINQTLKTLEKSWNNQDLEKVSSIAETTKESFIIETGFENNDDIQDIIQAHLYSVEFQNVYLSIDNWSKSEPVAKAKIKLTTYDNLEVLNVIIMQLINDDSEIDRNYNHNDFVARNIDKIKSAVEDIKKDYIKTILVTFKYDSFSKNWSIPFETNKDFYNAMSGNMISFHEEVEPTVEI